MPKEGLSRVVNTSGVSQKVPSTASQLTTSADNYISREREPLRLPQTPLAADPHAHAGFD
jgi:hypothetical protein